MPEETTTPTTKIREHSLNFGRTLDFTDENGKNYPAAFCVPGSSVDPVTKTITLTETFYGSIAEFEAGQPPISAIDGGVRRIVFRAERFDRFVGKHAQIIAACAMLIHSTFDEVKDTPGVTGDMESFFASASAVILPPQE